MNIREKIKNAKDDLEKLNLIINDYEKSLSILASEGSFENFVDQHLKIYIQGLTLDKINFNFDNALNKMKKEIKNGEGIIICNNGEFLNNDVLERFYDLVAN